MALIISFAFEQLRLPISRSLSSEHQISFDRLTLSSSWPSSYFVAYLAPKVVWSLFGFEMRRYVDSDDLSRAASIAQAPEP
ncbi:uncharacterized protein DFL_007764 [Arthrobotrys flagrans]|uniref:Uncharacterized protein n=1 Tax=Arthrobotrys flagrans TaxID=97331 RepID=A0A436ZWM0_ARTFL|nr:hypothetical protein DFL_007764 [Arthrobotrys flagrans]